MRSSLLKRCLWIAGAAGLGTMLLSACTEDPGPSINPPPPPDNTVEPSFNNPVHGSFRSPLRVALTPAGNLLVTDSRLGMVILTDSASLEPHAAFTVNGKPLGVALSGSEIFVGNETTQTVDVYSPNGIWERSFGAGVVTQPADIAVDPALGLVFVADGGEGAVKIFEISGRLNSTISAVHAPTGVALDVARREVLVSDYGSPADPAAIRIFSYDSQNLGSLVGMISGSGTAEFSRPRGLAVDEAGRIYVADAVLAQVLVFDRDTGNRITRLGSGDPALSDLRVPTDVAVDENGVVFVSSTLTRAMVSFLGPGAQP